MEKKIIFYGPNDWGNYWDINRVHMLLEKEDKNLTLDDILELYEIKKFKQCIPPELKESIEYKNIFSLSKQKFYKNFPNINDDTIAEKFNEITVRGYRFDFFKAIEKKKIYKILTNKSWDSLVQLKKFSVVYVLSYKNLVDKWGESLFEYFKNNPQYIPRIIDVYINPQESKKKKCLPKEIDNPAAWNELIEIYIDYPKANPNHLKNISEAPSIKNFKIDDYLKFKAHKKYQDILKKLFDQHTSSLQQTIKVIFSNDEEWKDVKFDQSKRELVITISKKWILNNLDYPTILNNFIYLFGITDIFCRSSLVSLKSQETSAESLFENFTNYSFKNNRIFEENFSLQQLLMRGYYDLLLSNGIRLEQVCAFFFNQYIPREFNIKGFHFNSPTPNTTYLEKCRNLFSEIDNILKQYKLYSTSGKIDINFLNFSSTPTDISNVPSLINNKYIYTSEEGNIATNLLFSDQHFVSLQVKYNVKNCYEAFDQHNILYTQIDDFDKNSINWLIERDLIVKNHERLILNKTKVNILKSIYEYGEYEPYYSNSNIKTVLIELEQNNLIRYGKTLLSEPEMDFYYYICNNKKFTNGLALRNKYSHANSTTSEKDNESNFYIVLIILIILIIRINEELCWQDDHVRSGKE